MTRPDYTPPEPIVVRDNPAKEITAQSVRVLLLAGFAVGASQFIQSEVAMVAVMGAATMAAGFLATYVVGLLKLLKDHRQRRRMARALPDTQAVVK